MSQEALRAKSAKESKRHHYVPEFYLRRWCTEDENGSRLWVTRLVNGKVVDGRYSPKSTGHDDQLYTLKEELLVRGPTGDYLEREFFGPIDTDGAEAMEVILTAGPDALTPKQKRAWTLFLSAMFERHRDEVRGNERRARELTEDIVREEVSRAPSERLRRAITSTIAVHDPKLFADNMVRWTMVQGIQDKSFLEYLESMAWVTVNTGNRALITSDSPFVVNAGSRRRPVDFAWIALSPSLLFMLLPQSEFVRGEGPPDEEHAKARMRELLAMIVPQNEVFLLQERPRCIYSHVQLADEFKERLRSALAPWD